MTSLLEDSRRPDITFHNDGRIDITARLVRKLGIGKGDVIDVKTDGIEYFLYVRHRAADLSGTHEAQCYPTNSGKSHNFRCYSARLCKALIGKVAASAKQLKLQAGSTVELPVICKPAVPLITRNPL